MKLSDVTGFLVVGCGGKMGADWCVQLLEGGYNVIGFDSSETARESARAEILKGLTWVEKKRKDRERNRIHPDGFAEEAIGRFKIVGSIEEAIDLSADFQIVLECIFEDMEAKQVLITKLASEITSECIFWSNTSSLDVEIMAQPAGAVKRMVGTHGMNPVYQMPAVEMVKTKVVDDQVFDLSREILEKLGKLPFTAANVTGFWVNKHLVPFMNEAFRALERGEITVADGDKGLHGSLGHPQGVFKLADFIGAHTMYRVTVAMYLATQDPRYYPPAILIKMINSKTRGVIDGKGFYVWDGFKPVEPVDFSDCQLTSSETMLFTCGCESNG